MSQKFQFDPKEWPRYGIYGQNALCMNAHYFVEQRFNRSERESAYNIETSAQLLVSMLNIASY